MSKWSNLLLDVDYMKQNATNASKIVTLDISYFGMVNGQILQDAMIARFQLDQLLLDEQSLIDKWAQVKVYDPIIKSIMFEGKKQECIDWVSENDFIGSLVILEILPTDVDFDWNECFEKIRKRCNLKIEPHW